MLNVIDSKNSAEKWGKGATLGNRQAIKYSFVLETWRFGWWRWLTCALHELGSWNNYPFRSNDACLCVAENRIWWKASARLESRERKTIDDYYDQPQTESHGRKGKKEQKLLTSSAELELFSFFWWERRHIIHHVKAIRRERRTGWARECY